MTVPCNFDKRNGKSFLVVLDEEGEEDNDDEETHERCHPLPKTVKENFLHYRHLRILILVPCSTSSSFSPSITTY